MIQKLHCPSCALGILERQDKKLSCSTCGFVYYHNVATAVAAVIVHEGSILMTVRKFEPLAGTLDLPGGFVDYDESAEEALQREIYEELHLVPRSMKYLFSVPNRYLYAGTEYRTLDLIYAVTVDSLDSIEVADDVADWKLIPKEEISIDYVGLSSIKTAVARIKKMDLPS